MNLIKIFILSSLFVIFSNAKLFSQANTYAFVVLTIQVEYNDVNTMLQDHETEKLLNKTPGSYQSKHYKTYYVSSSIKSFSLFDEDTKYKFMDNYQNSFKNYPGNSSSKIKKRQCFVFNSYSAASKAREKYVTD